MKKAIIYAAVSVLTVSAVAQPPDEVWTEPQVVEGINFPRTDFYPSISADGAKLYFASTRSNNEDIYVSEKIDGLWSTPLNLGPPINSDQRDVCPSISSDGRTLYFVSYGRDGGHGDYDIWYSRWEDSCECWTEPMNAGANINTPGPEWSPSISSDGTKLYFASAWPLRPDHLGGMDLYVSDFGPDGWEPAINLGINTYDDEYCPSIASDDTTLYFASWHHHNLPCWHGGGVDLFVVYNSNGQWQNMANLCDPLNTEAWERSPSISFDRDTLYFASRRDSDYDDIYYSVRVRTEINEDDNQSNDDKGMEMNISPNPFNSSTNITIDSEISTIAHFSIFNISGQRIYFDKILLFKGQNTFRWPKDSQDFTDLSSGIYFLTLKGSHNLYRSKILKLR